MKRYSRVWRVCVWLMSVMALTGCASNGAVKCEGRLHPINAPSSVVHKHVESNVATSDVAVQEVER